MDEVIELVSTEMHEGLILIKTEEGNIELDMIEAVALASDLLEQVQAADAMHTGIDHPDQLTMQQSRRIQWAIGHLDKAIQGESPAKPKSEEASDQADEWRPGK